MQLEIRANRSYRDVYGDKVTLGQWTGGVTHPYPYCGNNGQRYSVTGKGNVTGHELVAEWSEPADADGWITWAGGECPVAPETVVEPRSKYGTLPASVAKHFCWQHGKGFDSILAYRIVSPLPVTMEPDSALDVQVGGEHYKGMVIQPIEYIHANGLQFAEGCVVKYVSRWRAKNGIADLEKARHFLDLLIELEQKKGGA